MGLCLRVIRVSGTREVKNGLPHLQAVLARFAEAVNDPSGTPGARVSREGLLALKVYSQFQRNVSIAI
jgi:hypothetical protein